jgi:hypothetical protein
MKKIVVLLIFFISFDASSDDFWKELKFPSNGYLQFNDSLKGVLRPINKLNSFKFRTLVEPDTIVISYPEGNVRYKISSFDDSNKVIKDFKIKINFDTFFANYLGYGDTLGNRYYDLLIKRKVPEGDYSLYFITSMPSDIYSDTTKRIVRIGKTVNIKYENSIDNNQMIYPNPASDYIEINVGAGSKPALMIEFEIFNIFGELQELPRPSGTPSKEGEVRIDISNLSPGVYFIRIGDKFEKIIKY